MKLLTVAFAILLLMQPMVATADAPTDQVGETVNQLLTILNDPQLKESARRISAVRSSDE